MTSGSGRKSGEGSSRSDLLTTTRTWMFASAPVDGQFVVVQIRRQHHDRNNQGQIPTNCPSDAGLPTLSSLSGPNSHDVDFAATMQFFESAALMATVVRYPRIARKSWQSLSGPKTRRRKDAARFSASVAPHWHNGSTSKTATTQNLGTATACK